MSSPADPRHGKRPGPPASSEGDGEPRAAADRPAEGRFRLVTLGRLALLDPTGRDEPSLTTRRRKLALLAYLALQRRPVPRSVVLEMFWGERDEERARRSLSDALSHLRRVLGHDLVATYASELTPALDALPVIDAVELEEAAHAGRHERVLELYGGPFLHGVFVEGSASFEDWSAERRTHFAELFAAASAGRCLASARARRWTECATVARRWLEQRPGSEDAALYYLNALKAEGTRDALREALRGYRWLAARLARDLDDRPGPAVQELARRIERSLADDAVTAPTVERSAEPSVKLVAPLLPAPVAPPLVTQAAAPQAASTEPPPATEPLPPLDGARDPAPTLGFTAAWRASWRSSRRARMLRGGLLAAVAVALVLAVVARLQPRKAMASAGAPPLRHRALIAILPVTVSASDSANEWLRDGIPAMIEAKLARAEGIEATSAEPTAAGRATVREASAGADLVASGAVARHRDSLVLDLVIRGRDGRIVANPSLTAGDAVHLADAAAVQLLLAASVSPEGPSLGELETPSVEAYQMLLEARRTVALGDRDRAAAILDRAIAVDSGFVSALLMRFQLAQGDLATAARVARLMARAWSRASALDRMEVDAYDAYWAGDHARADFLAAALLERFSHSARAFDMYVEIAKSHGRFADADRVVATRTALLERGGAEETPVLCGLYVLRADLQREFGDARRSDSLAHVAVSRCPYQRDIWQSAGWDMLAAGDLAGARRAAERYGGFSDAPSRWLTGRILLRERRYAAAESLAARWQRDSVAQVRDEGYDLEVMVARERGQFERSLRALRRWRDAGGEWIPQIYIDGAGRTGDTAAVRAIVAPTLRLPPPFLTLRGDRVVTSGGSIRGWAWHHALVADALLRNGDTGAARAAADSLATFGPRSYYGRDWRLHHHLRGMLAARAGRWAEAARELEAARWGHAGWTRTSVELADAYVRLGRPGDAIDVLRAAYGANLDAMGRYAPLSEIDLHMARAFAAAGAPDSAAVYGGYVRRAWASADPRVRAQLAALP